MSELIEYLNKFSRFPKTEEQNINKVNLEKIKQLVNSNGPVGNIPRDKNPLGIYLQLGGNNIEIIKYLIQYSKDTKAILNNIDSMGDTPLHIYLNVAKWKRFNKVEPESDEHIQDVVNLLRTEENINIQNNDGITPLHLANEFNNINLLEQLSTEKSVNVSDNFNRVVFVEAIKENNIDKVDLFINKGAHVNELDDDGNSPIVHSPSKEIKKFLLKKGSKFIRNKFHVTRDYIDLISAKRPKLENVVVNCNNSRNFKKLNEELPEEKRKKMNELLLNSKYIHFNRFIKNDRRMKSLRNNKYRLFLNRHATTSVLNDKLSPKIKETINELIKKGANKGGKKVNSNMSKNINQNDKTIVRSFCG